MITFLIGGLLVLWILKVAFLNLITPSIKEDILIDAEK